MDPVDYFFQTGFKLLMQEQPVIAEQIAGVIADPLSQSDVQAVLESLKAEQIEKAAITQRENVASLWDEYDRDKNGVLQPQELEELLQDLLCLEQKNLSVTVSAMLEQSLQGGLHIALNIAKGQGATAEDLRGVEMAMGSMASLLEKQKPVIEATSLQLLAQREANLAADVQSMLETMDVNHDGVVTRDEFEAKFLEAYGKITLQTPFQQGIP